MNPAGVCAPARLAWLAAGALLLLSPSPVCGAQAGAKLAELYAQQVDRRMDLPEAEQSDYARLVANALAREGLQELASQYVLLVDGSVFVQAAMMPIMNRP